MKTTRLAKRLVITSLLTLLAPIVLFAPQAYAETYVAGQFGLTFTGNGLTNGDLTTTSFTVNGGTFNIPSGTTVSDQSLKNSLLLGAKIGHYFSRARWFGLEAEMFYTTPHIKQQDITFRNGTNEFTFPGVPGVNFHVLTIAPLNFVFRYPGNRLQPYIGVGPGIFMARLKDPSVTQGDNSQSSTKLGLNSFIGVRYYLTRHVSTFVEGKYNYVRFNFSENPNFFGFDATYSPISVAVGINYHF